MFDEVNTTRVHEIMNDFKERRDGRQINDSIVFATPRKTNKPVPNLFSPPRELPKHTIKDMLAKAQDKSEIVIDDTMDSDNSGFLNQSQRLFKDPESSFDTSVSIYLNKLLSSWIIFLFTFQKLHETYRAPVKRSRKVRKMNEYVYDFDSVDSEDESLESPVKEAKKRKKKNDSRGTEDSEDESREAKRPRKMKKTKDDVSIFIIHF